MTGNEVKENRTPANQAVVAADGSKKTARKSTKTVSANHVSMSRRIAYGALFAVWTVGAFYLAQFVLVAILWLLAQANIALPPTINETVLQTVMSIITYLLAIALATLAPWLILRQKTTLKEVGLGQRLPLWRDIGLAPVAYVGAMILSWVALVVAQVVLPDFDPMTKQQIGFESVTARYEMLLAFFSLVVLAPVCEELLFRGYMYGKLRKYFNAFWAIAVTSIVFGMLHVYGGPGMPLQWNAALSITILAFFLGALREYTGSVWAGILLHMIKNMIAFMALFVLPLLGISSL